MLQGGAAARRRSAAAVMIGACLWSSAGSAQDCAFPAEAEAFAIASLRSRMMVGALACQDRDIHDAFLHRFEQQVRGAYPLLRDHFARTAGGSWRTAFDNWNTRDANAWSEHQIRVGQRYCDDTRRLALELAGLPPGPSLVAVAERVSAEVPSQAPGACRAPDHPAAPLQPR